MENEQNERTVRGRILSVPFQEKDEVKQLGARWDAELRKWFVPAGIDAAPFSRWFEASANDRDK